MNDFDFGQLGQFLPDLGEINNKLARVSERVAREPVTAESGGGMVSIVGTADMRVKSVKLDNNLLSLEDNEMTSDLITAAFNQLIEKCKERSAEIATEELGPLASMMQNSPLTSLIR
ncbi:MAG: YbaB/EbfC family nucleoid-associated protein [Deltaproteobacteria bacterium]|nr:YbaB/EbfC family nucleoid-associated protein [Deltaproteobacteria bacterium]